jgi:ATP-dependent Clp protease ATP-binding subunit ClpC
MEFNARAQRIIGLAEDEARSRNHDWVGTEHILLGLIGEGEGIAAKTLESLGISLPVVHQAVEGAITAGQHARSGRIPFTGQASRVLEAARHEAAQLGSANAGTEHILLGLLLEGDGIAARVLRNLGVSVNPVREQVLQFKHGLRGRSPAPAVAQEIFTGQPVVVPPRPSRTGPEVMSRFGTNLTRQAQKDQLYPAIGRDEEIDEVIRALSQNAEVIPLLIGDAATRTTVIEGLALRIASGEVPQELQGTQLYYCDLDGIAKTVAWDGSSDATLRNRIIELLAGLAIPGNNEAAERRRIGSLEVVAAILEEARIYDDAILVLDGLPKLAAERLLMPMLTSVGTRIIGATDDSHYRQYIEKDGALSGRLRLVRVADPATAYALGKLRIALRAAN